MIKLYNTDCLPAMREMPDNAFDLAIVDPPYGIGMGNRKGRHSKEQTPLKYDKPKYKTSDWDSSPPTKEYFNELLRVSRNQIIWGGNHFELPISRGWVFWDKKQILPNYSAGELAWTSFDTILRMFGFHWNGKIRTGMEKGYNSIHPTQKPIAVYKWLLHNYAKEGQTILDTHLGSGSIAIACHDYGYDLTGYEIDTDYYNAATKRLKQHQSQLMLSL